MAKEEKPSQNDEGKKPELRKQVSGEGKERKQMLGQKLMNKFKGRKELKVLAWVAHNGSYIAATLVDIKTQFTWL